MSTIEVQVDLWKMQRFTDLGFDSGEIGRLLFWGTSPHDVEGLLYQAGRRTTCSHAQALRIVRPLELIAPPTQTDCVVCAGRGCEFCPKAS